MLLNQTRQRLSLKIRGTVQGVGFRPFVYRLATELNLVGWVSNSGQGVLIEVEGEQAQLNTFQKRLETDKPPRSQIDTIESKWLQPSGEQQFNIHTSATHADGSNQPKSAIVLPDLATCADCLAEISNPRDRRYRYPFTNCTNCGPRYSIITAVPYDRSSTSMHSFPMCPSCQQEYSNPLSRRFHAQPNACPDCGPHLELWDANGKIISQGDRALLETARRITAGQVIAIKGLGGFHLVVDARNSNAVRKLRQSKHRPHKPLAVIYPTLEQIKADCRVTELEENLLCSPSAPIVLLRKKERSHFVCEDIAPRNPFLGVMLPYTPLHHLLMDMLHFPIVATSGNLSDEPICFDEREALERLHHIADFFLVHNRPIVRPVDDSIVRVMNGRPLVLRRARGYAPVPIKNSNLDRNPNILAVGGHTKNAIALSCNHQIFLSQHIGDLETEPAFANFRRVIASLSSIYEFQPDAIACDSHPNYLSSQFAHQLAQQLHIPLIPVQHHYAHVLACMGEHQIAAPVLGVAWDGTGYGLDGSIWGGEFLAVRERDWERPAYFRPFPLPGGEQAIKYPYRAALGLLWEVMGAKWRDIPYLQFLHSKSAQELNSITVMLTKQLHTPFTSSVGRLFDAIAALLGICQQSTFEGQAAMELEFVADPQVTDYYEFTLQGSVIDWSPMITAILHELEQNIPCSEIAAKFHNTLVEIVVAVAQRVGISQVVLTGGCFQNQYLTERMIKRLRQENFQPFWHECIPPNDGGLAVGQAIAALRHLQCQAHD